MVPVAGPAQALLRRAVAGATGAAGLAVAGVTGTAGLAVGAVTGAVTGAVDLAVEARETARALHRVALRADAVTAELEEPLRALAPGLRRLAAALDDPVVERLPELLRQVQDDVLPVLRTLADTSERVATVTGQGERVLAFVDEASRSLGGLAGVGLLSRRRPGGPGTRVVPGEVVDPPSP